MANTIQPSSNQGISDVFQEENYHKKERPLEARLKEVFSKERSTSKDVNYVVYGEKLPDVEKIKSKSKGIFP